MTSASCAGVEPEYLALPPGQTIGRYEIVFLLRQDPFGPSYRGRDRELGHDVIIEEFLPPALAMRDEIIVVPRSPAAADAFRWGRRRFADEGRCLSRLQHVHFVASVIDVVEAFGTSYVVLDLVPGITLEDRLRGGSRLAPEEVDRLLRSLLEGLRQIHEAELLHCDIRPANIVLDMSGWPTLTNFGSAKAAMIGRMPSMALLTPDYTAPEQLTGDKQGQWTDIYSLAATMYCVIVGHPPPAAIERLQADKYRRLADLAPAGFTLGMLTAIDIGLSMRPGERLQSVASWQAMLPKALGAPPPVAPPAPPSPIVGARTERAISVRRRALQTGGVVATVALAIGAWWSLADRTTAPPVPVPATESAKQAELNRPRDEARPQAAALEEPQRSRTEMEAVVEAAEEVPRQSAAAAKQRAEAEAEAAIIQLEQQIMRQLEVEAIVRQQAEAERQTAAAEANDTARTFDSHDNADPVSFASSPATNTGASSLAPSPEGAPGLLIKVKPGESLGSLYRRVYRGLTPPPFESVAAINPGPVRPGDIVTFPPPANGWHGRD
jgi:serine/threonine protein kinase